MGIEIPKNQTPKSSVEKDPIAFRNLIIEAVKFYKNNNNSADDNAYTFKAAAKSVLTMYSNHYSGLSRKQWCILKNEIATEVKKEIEKKTPEEKPNIKNKAVIEEKEPEEGSKLPEKPPAKNREPGQLDLFE